LGGVFYFQKNRSKKMTDKKSGAEIFWESLIHQGVEVVFGYPGAATLPIYGAMDKYEGQIRHILTRHEQGATHMADGYARAGGKVGWRWRPPAPARPTWLAELPRPCEMPRPSCAFPGR
jgi:hypothetical protein